ncbi:MAG: hypothetical protein IKF90_07295 [Parasporobacterium sp.]|nr:hypothetical protein [Parasporobacterium sp.]
MKEYTGKTYMTIPEAVKVTGLSSYFLRNGLKAGTIPHIMSGPRYLVNIPLLLETLEAESRKKAGA